jgi:hypothetical protein
MKKKINSLKIKKNSNKNMMIKLYTKNKWKENFCILLRRRERKDGGEEKTHQGHINGQLPTYALPLANPQWSAFNVTA